MDLRPVTDPLKSFLFVAGGWACLGLAAIGVVTPLPTTPFVLAASWCFYRGSPRIHAWLHRSKVFGPVVGLSMLLNSMYWFVRYVFFCAVAIGLFVIWRVPTLPDDAPKAPRTRAE